MPQMQVRKRNGQLEDVSFDKILRRIEFQAKGLKVDATEISKKVIQGVNDGISTSNLDILTTEIAAALATNHPDYSTLAARIAITNLYKETPKTFSEAIDILYKDKRVSQEVFDVTTNNKEKINSHIDNSRDNVFDFFGFKTLERAYLLRASKKVIERPQYMWMRVSIGIWGEDLEKAFRMYNSMSQKKYVHATPTLFNSGTNMPQLSSCFLLANKGDSLEGLMATCTDIARISSKAGGIGVHIHDVRAEGSFIYRSGGTSSGLLPLLKNYNELAKWWNQSGKRKGSFAIYLEPWHKDISVFLDIRKNHGKEEMRARDLFNALWIPDLFMERVETNSKWTLFCPNEVLIATGKRLQDVFGDKFKELYELCESLNIGKQIEARDLWNHIVEAQTETGTPYIAYKDAANKKSNQSNIGTIKSSNLCIEVMEVSTPTEQAVCNLASLSLPSFLYSEDDGNLSYDFEALGKATSELVDNLNQVININYYPTKETKESNINHRPIGIGVQGLADVFALMKMSFDSYDAKVLNRAIFETIYYYALKSSMELSVQEGEYKSFENSPASKGFLQFDMWSTDVYSESCKRYNWNELKQDIQIHGLRNSLLVALMPTASTSQILGNNECFEPFNSNLSSRRTLAGEFVIINKHLIKDLEEIDLWNPEMKNKLTLEKGSVQKILEIPQDIRERYKTAYEISQKTIIDMAADRGAFICQSQSMNLFIANPNSAKLTSMHFYAWKAGLKTGMYYLRTKAAVDAIQFTVEKKAEAIVEEIKEIVCNIDNKEDCEICGA